MKLKDIVEYISRPFILIDPAEEIDYKSVQLMVKLDNKYYVGHNIHGIQEDIINFMPEVMDCEIDKISAIKYMPDKPTIAVKLKK